MDLSPNQINQLQNLGLNPPKAPQTASKTNLIPLFSISGLTLLSIGGLILLKSKDSSYGRTDVSAPSTDQNIPSPTQVPKSIQHYLLASQQYFTKALELQQSAVGADPSVRPSSESDGIIALLNQSITAASDAIKSSPSDYRGFEQRARIYQALLDSQPQLIDVSIADYRQAQLLNPSSAELTRQLASLYAKKGDLQNTLTYLSATVSLEPTKAQNFYDLAKIQQQAGLLPEALKTYNSLLPLISDISQKSQLETEKKAIEKIISQNNLSPSSLPTPVPQPSISTEGNLLEANTSAGLIIAAPQTPSKISVQNQTDSNSLSGTATLPSGQKQIIIKNTQLKTSSQVYLTILSGGKNQSLEVLSKSKDSFTAGFISPLSEDVTFKWWIVN
jgi:tetratricopeptide (TPR) repeat protein